MKKFQHLDFVKFHTPVDEKEAAQIFLVVDEDTGEDEERKALCVKEIHQTLPFPCVNTFIKADFVLHHRPTEEEKAEIKKGRK